MSERKSETAKREFVARLLLRSVIRICLGRQEGLELKPMVYWNCPLYGGFLSPASLMQRDEAQRIGVQYMASVSMSAGTTSYSPFYSPT